MGGRAGGEDGGAHNGLQEASVGGGWTGQRKEYVDSVGADNEVPVDNNETPRPADLERALLGIDADDHVCEMQLADGARRGFGVEGQVFELVVEIHAVAEIPRLCISARPSI